VDSSTKETKTSEFDVITIKGSTCSGIWWSPKTMIAQRDFAIFNIGGQHLPE
jgi:hypothetical protein